MNTKTTQIGSGGEGRPATAQPTRLKPPIHKQPNWNFNSQQTPIWNKKQANSDKQTYKSADLDTKQITNQDSPTKLELTEHNSQTKLD